MPSVLPTVSTADTTSLGLLLFHLQGRSKKMTVPDPWAAVSAPNAAGSQIKRSNSIPLDMHEIETENPLHRSPSMGRISSRQKLSTSGMSIRCYSLNTLFVFCLAALLISWGSTCGYRQTVWSAAFYGCHQGEVTPSPVPASPTDRPLEVTKALQKHRHSLHNLKSHQDRNSTEGAS
jgi:hypothetical protein